MSWSSKSTLGILELNVDIILFNSPSLRLMKYTVLVTYVISHLPFLCQLLRTCAWTSR